MRLQKLLVLFAFSAILPLFAADLAGRWAVTATDPEGQVHKSEMILKQDGESWAGIVKGNQRDLPMEQIKVDGDNITFKLPWGEMKLTIKMKLEGGELKGTFENESGDSGPLTAKKLAESGRLLRP